ncbi:MAG: hypothetical protein J6W81_02170 [Lentisphaeria bacterium]|nr:hypothetical protein [Lentisphaeria bacterium]
MIQYSFFDPENGNCTETFFSGISLPAEDFATEVRTLLDSYENALNETGCSEKTEFLLRFHLSDITNQAPLLRSILGQRNTFLSIIGQPPAGGRIALEAWHISPFSKESAGDNNWKIRFKNYEVLLARGKDPESTGSYAQTAAEFSALENLLARYNGKIADNTVRTWLYCRDVDNNYAGLVEARNHWFERIGLTAQTHFIASTGIEAQSEMPSRLISMDSLSFPGMDPEQLIYLADLEMLSSTALYGVSFERGTRMIFGDRSHYYISGTASIDKYGKVLFLNDPAAQTGRIIDNMEALLKSSSGSLSDLKFATVYLRDLRDVERVRSVLKERISFPLPMIFLQAPVCRPAWLVEIEAFGVNHCGSEQFAPLI